MFLKLLRRSKAPSLDRKSENVLSINLIVLCSRVICWVLKLLYNWFHTVLLLFSKKFYFASANGTTSYLT